MMRNIKPFIIDLAIGIVMIAIGLVWKTDYYSTLVFAGGCGLGGGSLVQLIRLAYYKHPANLGKYEKYIHEEHIKAIDERKQFLRAKAGQNTYKIMLFVFLILDIALAILHVEAWIVAMIALLFIVQCLVYMFFYRFFEKKM